VQRAAAAAGQVTAVTFARTMVVTKGRATVASGTAAGDAAAGSARLDAVPLWLVGRPAAQVAQVLLELAAAVNPGVAKASEQVAAAGSTTRAPVCSEDRLAAQLAHGLKVCLQCQEAHGAYCRACVQERAWGPGAAATVRRKISRFDATFESAGGPAC
jgi:hypothetical protein